MRPIVALTAGLRAGANQVVGSPTGSGYSVFRYSISARRFSSVRMRGHKS